MMTPEQSAAYVIGQAACLMGEIAGMQAQNSKDVMNGRWPTFGQTAFQDIIDKYSCHHNAAITAFDEANSNV